MSLAMHATSSWPSCGLDWEVLALYLSGFPPCDIAESILNATLSADGVRSIAQSRDFSRFSMDATPGRTGVGSRGVSASPSPVREGVLAKLATSAESTLSDAVLLDVAPAGSSETRPMSGTSTAVATPTVDPTPSLCERIAVQELVDEQIQLYEFLEKHYLPSPYLFVSACGVPLPMADRLRVIQMFYELDEGLAELWFGDRLSRIDVEDDDLIEVGLPGLSEVSVKRQWRNLRRVCKVVTAGYRGRDGLYIARDIPLVQCIQQVFVLPMESSRLYATLVFGFEHRLDTSALEPFEVHELASLCSAVAGCWCDSSELILSEAFCKACWLFGKHLDDSRVVSELETKILGSGDAPRLFQQIKDTLDEMQKAISPSPAAVPHPVTVANHPAVAPAATPPVATPTTPVVPGMTTAASTATVESLTNAGNSIDTSMDVSENKSPPAQLSTAPLPAPAQPPNVAQYSRRFAGEFPSILRTISRVCIQFSSSEKLRDVLDRFHAKIYAPLLAVGRMDSSHMVGPALPSSHNCPASHDANNAASGAVLSSGSFCINGSVLMPPPPVAAVVGGSDTATLPSPSSHCHPTATAAAAAVVAADVIRRTTESRRYIRELCMFLAALSKTFPTLQCVSSRDHDELDDVARDFLAVLRLFAQLLLAHE